MLDEFERLRGRLGGLIKNEITYKLLVLIALFVPAGEFARGYEVATMGARYVSLLKKRARDLLGVDLAAIDSALGDIKDLIKVMHRLLRPAHQQQLL